MEVDWSAVLGGSSFAGLVALVIRDLIRAWATRGKINAEAGMSEAAREVTLSDAAVAAMERLTTNYEARIKAVQADAQAMIAGARADAANSVAAAMHEVSTTRALASEAQRAAEAAERVVRLVRDAAWSAGAADPRVERVRQLVGDGGPMVGMNGTPMRT